MDDRCTTPMPAAAINAGRRRRLPVCEPEIRAARSNVLVRPGPAVATAPATTWWLRLGVAGWTARDMALSAFLADRGAPVIPPLETAGPHVARGFPMTLWRFTLHDQHHRFSPAERGRRSATPRR